MIEFRGVSYFYGDTPGILGINLRIDRGVTIIIGPNGSGKTTLLKVASLLYKPSSGDILFESKNPWKDHHYRNKVRGSIVYVHEKPVLFRGTVIENIMLPLILRGYDKDHAEKKAMEILRAFDLDYIADRKRNQLSAGQKQMVSIMRAFAVQPKYLFLDEPTNSLDMENRKKLINYIARNLNETIIVIATHDLLLPIELKGRIFRLNNGKVVEELTAGEFKEKYINL